MLNIVIFCGGTGSIALQEGLAEIYGYGNYNLDIIINAYDNGKSTGICRKVFDNKILGPSDLRKNHMTQFRLQKHNELLNCSSPESVLYKLFNYRIDSRSKENYYKQACELIEQCRCSVTDIKINRLRNLLDYFFFEDIQNQVWRTSLTNVSFKDFSIANIFYSASAAKNGYSLRLAGKELSSILDIIDNVHLISDVNLFLEAHTESGKVISDESEIVEWDNPEDKIISVKLKKDGEEYIPSVDEGTDLTQSKSCKEIINQADIIIFSSGTQWSSLIPSYMHSGLRKILSNSKAKKYIIMNNVEDRDMKGVTADDIVDIIARNIPISDLTAVVNLDAVPGMNCVEKVRCISGHISGNNYKHDPIKLVSLIMKDYYSISTFSGTYIFDLDGTLWDERANNRGKSVGEENINLFSGIIHSGNNYEHVRDAFMNLYHQETVVDIYSDFGNVYFSTDNYDPVILSDKYIIDDNIVSELEKIPEIKGKIKIRGFGCVITIKPLINRELLLAKVQDVLSIYAGKYTARISGHTSIDITVEEYDKKTMILEILKKHNLKKKEVIFVGNETEAGAEENIKNIGIKTIQVDDVYECNILLKTIHLD